MNMTLTETIKNLKTLVGRIPAMWRVLRQFAPYALMELLLPGGTILAILFWLYRRRQVAKANDRLLAGACDQAHCRQERIFPRFRTSPLRIA
jgi:hypothetical protein